MIFFEKVSKIYSPTAIALEDINLAIEPKEFVSIVGQSGSGKTTLLKLLLAEEQPTSGRVFFESVDVNDIPHKKRPEFRRKIGTVFEDFRLLSNKTAYENIAFAMEAAGKSPEEIERDVPQVLEITNMAERANHFPDELSRGERQRIAIARAIINQPDVIIADEPTGNLDPLNTWEIINILKKINELGTTIILATHNKSVIDSLGRRVVTLEKGKIIRDDKQGRYIV
jgi:cell division transport system ATP-binding protein